MSLANVTQAAPAVDACIPRGVWDLLHPDDQSAYLRLKLQFHQQQRSSGKESRVVSFHKELLAVRSFVERRIEGKEERSIISGACFAGKFICVNTRQLKCFLGRCKSSINGCFQQMGYVALRTKTKARNCVLSVMHSLISNVDNLRQWTVRCTSQSANFSIISSFPEVDTPSIDEKDLVPQQQHHNNNNNNNNNSTKSRINLMTTNSNNNLLLSSVSLALPQFVQPMVTGFLEQKTAIAEFEDSEWGIDAPQHNYNDSSCMDIDFPRFESRFIDQIQPFQMRPDLTEMSMVLNELFLS